MGCIKWKSVFHMHRFRSSHMYKVPSVLCSPLIHTIVANDSVSGHWRPWSDCPDGQSDQGLCCPHMPEDAFSHSPATYSIQHSLAKLLVYSGWNTSQYLMMTKKLGTIMVINYVHLFSQNGICRQCRLQSDCWEKNLIWTIWQSIKLFK